MSELRGYVTDVPYVLGFKSMLAPAWLDHVALLWSFEPPCREGGFAWCDLGCGQGVTDAILAATHPGGMFVGIDAMPGHIDHARRLATEIGAGNAQFHATDFAAALDLRLPQFDYIVAHGVYSWVGAEVRADLHRFIDRRLKPGGLVYLSYNAMPGWLGDLPFQRLVRELGDIAEGGGAARFAAAAATIRCLTELGAPALRDSYILRELAQRPEDYPIGYLVHEFMHAGWEALYVTDVRRDLAGIGLVPVGSTTLIENFDAWVLDAKARDVLEAMPEGDVRELVRDVLIDQRLRCDVFARDARRLPSAEQQRRLMAADYALTRPEPAVAYTADSPAGRLRFDNPAARAIVRSMAAGPRPLAEIDGAAADLLANTLALCAAGDLRPVEPTRVPVAALNRALRRRLGGPEEIPVLALPCGTAIEIDYALRGLAAGDTGARWRAFLSAHGC
ncbi:MAG TPA: class I SAM-dependent methyltransferase [Stellaceae bacterium]|nr:class I SAM-dependent methyltransferase [Stellaceae bacterium]